MSRSLRSRPLTLYGNTPTSSIPPTPQDAYYQEQSTPTPSTAPSSAKSRLKKASQVGSNLKKRLSTRYATTDESGTSAGPQSASIPAVPSIPRQHYQDQPRLPTTGSGLDAYNIEEESEDEPHPNIPQGAHSRADPSYLQPYSARDIRSSDLASSSSGSGATPHAHYDAAPPPRSTSRNQLPVPSAAAVSTTPSSGRKPTLAWEGSSLRSHLHLVQQQGLDHIVELDSLRKQADQFDGTEYLRLHMRDGVSASTFSSTLNQTKDALRADVKSQAFDHYADFIAISSQVGALENEMIELKSLLGEWRSMPRVLEREDESGRSLLGNTATAALASSSSSRRNSILSLQQVYRAQLTSLWEGISNSQKFIPYKPGRHLVAEASDFVELNAATYRPTKNVALFLLDDLLLVASRRKGKMSTKVQLEAERCFALGDIVVVDLKDSSGGSSTTIASSPGAKSTHDTSTAILNSIKIKKGKETFVYRAERPESKKALLAAFRRVAEDLVSKRKKQARDGAGGGMLDVADINAGPGGRRASVYAGMQLDTKKASTPSPSSGASFMSTLAEEEAEEDGTDGVMKLATERIKEERKDPHRWMNDWSDSLAVDIALRRWPEAVEKALKGKAVLSTYSPTDPVHPMITAHLSRHTASLVSSLLDSIRSPTLRKTTLVQLSAHLSALGYSSVARQTFLASRTELLRRRKRSIKFEGEAELYVSELSMVVFGMVRNTSEWFMASWKEVGMASGFVKWALSEVHAFAMGFKRQVFGGNEENDNESQLSAIEVDWETVKRARRVAMESARQLKDVGLDFGFVLEELLKSPRERQQQVQQQQPPSRSGTTSQARSASGLSSRIAAFEGGDSKPTRPSVREESNPTRPLTLNRQRSNSSSTDRIPQSRAAGGDIPPVPSISISATQRPPPIPSLTLTLADEASGISHRISSADLPAVTAQEIRRMSMVQR